MDGPHFDTRTRSLTRGASRQTDPEGVEEAMSKRRAIPILLLGGMLLLPMVAGVTLAKDFTCKPGSTAQAPCKGTRRGDSIAGTTGADYIVAKKGKDSVDALGGNDVVFGGPGDDAFLGGEDGNDDVHGENGNDTIFGGSHDDRLDGGPGDDLISDSNGPLIGNPADADIVFDGPGNDFIDLQDGDGNDTLCSEDGETFDGSDAGDDVIDDPELCALLWPH